MGLSVVMDQPSTFSKRVMLAVFCQSADEFRGGVLSTLSAWVIGFASSWFGLEPGRKRHFPSACFYVMHKIMNKAISVMHKRGRPATGKTPTIALRAPDEFRAAVEKWAARQSDQPRLSEAIRRLVELGLKAKGR